MKTDAFVKLFIKICKAHVETEGNFQIEINGSPQFLDPDSGAISSPKQMKIGLIQEEIQMTFMYRGHPTIKYSESLAAFRTGFWFQRFNQGESN
jgi:hypothetical protein